MNGLLLSISNSVSPSGILPNQTVRVRASMLPNGVMQATSIEAVPAQIVPGIVMLNGVITAINPNQQIVAISGVQMSFANAASTANLSVRQPVRAFIIMTAPNTWEALAIIPLDNPFTLTQPLAPIATTDPSIPTIIAPVGTPEVQPPVSTPDSGDDDDDSGRGRGGDADDDDDNSGSGGGGDDDDDD